jgi:hypothetical protein
MVLQAGTVEMDWWDWLAILAAVVYLGTWRGFGPIGQPRNPPFPIWPDVGRTIRRLFGLS